jgi:hypothetical protein
MKTTKTKKQNLSNEKLNKLANFFELLIKVDKKIKSKGKK